MRTLNALLTQLQWKLHELSNNMLSIEQEIKILKDAYDLKQQKINESCTIPSIIVPEQEISRGYFITQLQQDQDESNKIKATLKADQQALKEQQIRLNIELKMLEKHQDATLKLHKQQDLLKEQNNSDEWVLQRKDCK